MDASRKAFVTVARVLRPHGRRGEVAAEILTDFPQRLQHLKQAELWDSARHTHAHGPSPRSIRSCWISHSRGGQAIFHFDGCDSMEEAKRLVGLEVQILLADRLPLPGGTYYVSDLIGCEVFEPGGTLIGRVREVDFVGETKAGTPILAVDSTSGEILIPLAQDICIAIDLAARRITIAPPEGLLELNRRSEPPRPSVD